MWRERAQIVKFVKKNLRSWGIFDILDAIFAMSQKCGEHKMLLDIAAIKTFLHYIKSKSLLSVF